jgi:hypothetical protein
MAMVGGIVCVVKARRTKARTMTIRVKDVIITRRLGRIANPAKMITSFTGVDQSLLLASSEVALSINVIKSLMLGTVLVVEGFGAAVTPGGTNRDKSLFGI